MLPLSNIEITFCKSNDYVRIASLVHCFAAVLLVNSSLPNWLRVTLVLILCISLLQLLRSPNHLYPYTKLMGYSTYWVVEYNTGKTMEYTKARIRFDGGLFIILQLRTDQTQVTAQKNQVALFIFKDQLTSKQHRMLEVITKIQRS